MIGKASEIRTYFVDGNCIGQVEERINNFLLASNESRELIDIKYQMLTDPACDNMLYVTALIIYK